MDSWIYPALDRLHSLGYLDSAFLGIRPWTRLSIAHMLEQSADRIDTDTGNDEARSIYLAVLEEVQPDIDNATELNHPSAAAGERLHQSCAGSAGRRCGTAFIWGRRSLTITGGRTRAGSTTTRDSAGARRRDDSRSTIAASINMRRARRVTRRRWRRIFPRTSMASRSRAIRCRTRFRRDRSRRRTMRGFWRRISRITCWGMRCRSARAITGWDRTRARHAVEQQRRGHL